MPPSGTLSSACCKEAASFTGTICFARTGAASNVKLMAKRKRGRVRIRGIDGALSPALFSNSQASNPRGKLRGPGKLRIVLAMSPIIAGAEVFLQPDIQADEKITAPHFLNLQFRGTSAPVAPRDRDGGPAES